MLQMIVHVTVLQSQVWCYPKWHW